MQLNHSTYMTLVRNLIVLLLCMPLLACGEGSGEEPLATDSATPLSTAAPDSADSPSVALVEKSADVSEATPKPSAATPVSIVTTAAPTPTPLPTQTQAPATATLSPVGLNRANPYSSSDLVEAPNWDIQIIETVRGDDAWALLQAANEFNDAPPEGFEYVLVRLHVRSKYADEEAHSISQGDFKITGSRLHLYSSAYVVVPDPALDAELYEGAETEGWASFLVGAGETDLILVVDELFSFDSDRYRYVALDENASITVSSELADIEPSELGLKRSEPAPIGQSAITEDWEVTIVEVERGADALALILQANMFNEEPEPGMEYVLARARVRYIGTEDKSVNIDASYFNSTGSQGVLYDLPMVVEPEPVLDCNLYPGGECEGWVALQAAESETGLIVQFEPWFDFGDENRRFLSLEP